MKGLLFVALLVSVVGSASADPTIDRDERGRPYRDVFGLEFHPLVKLQFDRVADPSRWTAGLSGGGVFEWDPLAVWFGYTLHDVLSDIEIVPWNGTSFVKVGLQQHIGEIGDVPTFVRAALVATVPTGPDKFSPGFESGFEFDMEPLTIWTCYTLRDIWLHDDDEVYPWDSEFDLALGFYW